jgi:anaerobic selenocysteine-containing dehydrogenase
MGFDEDCLRDSDDDMINQALRSPNPWLKGLTLENLEQAGHMRLNFDTVGHSPTLSPGDGESKGKEQQRWFLPYAKGEFRTLSGKAELYSEALKVQGLDPVAEFVPPDESRHSPTAEGYPLELLARKADNFLNSTFTNLPTLQTLEEKGLLEMHPEDAVARGIHDGDAVRVFNNRGEIELRAKVNDSVSPGVVAAKLNWAKLTRGGKNINVLTSEKLSDMGNSATFYSVLVEVGLLRPV